MPPSCQTPALLLDVAKVERNCRTMRERLEAHGVRLRPHVKTAKNVEVARLALGAEKGPITVSTLREAEHFLEHGFDDILYAVGVAPAKLERIAELAKQGARIGVIVDSVAAAQAVARFSRRLYALVEIDSDGHRAGIRPGDARLIEVASALGHAMRGVMTHAGDSYNCDSVDGIRRVAARERDAAVGCANALHEAGLECSVVSVGSTPTATFADSFEGVTDVRVGVYVFQDLVMAGLGVCSIDDIALSVAASIIGHQRDKQWLITDAGWMALSRDRGTARQRVDQGYGVVCGEDGRPIDDLIVADANQEHGIIARRGGGAVDFERFPIGTVVRILPNHACATAAQHARYELLPRGEAPARRWERVNGW
jgi:D-serine deaminase-like pyridoxal phosphate-dependent protein